MTRLSLITSFGVLALCVSLVLWFYAVAGAPMALVQSHPVIWLVLYAALLLGPAMIWFPLRGLLTEKGGSPLMVVVSAVTVLASASVLAYDPWGPGPY